jgi:HEAT repeat protein
MDKLATAKKGSGFFDLMVNEKAIVDDVEIDEQMIGLFAEDKFKTFVADAYQAELERMLRGIEARRSPVLEEVERECRDEAVDWMVAEVVLELLDADSTGREEYLTLLTRLSELMNGFLDTGRFEEISEIYNTLYSHSLAGRFREEAAAMIEYFFSSETSIEKLIGAFKIWGRHNREGVTRLARVMKRYLNEPLLDALSEETDPTVRKFFLSVLGGFRSDVIPEALRRLNDERWYVVRNMIYLLRECGGVKYVNRIKPLAKHADRRIAMEAVKTLLHFNVPGAFPYIRGYLQSKDLELRDQAIRLIGAYKVKEAVPYLVEIIGRRGLFGEEWYYKVSAVRALGEIGDPRVLDALARLARAKSFLFRGAVEELRLEIFRSLRNYPPASVRPLLEAGLSSKNKEIRVISEQMLSERWNNGVSGKDN